MPLEDLYFISQIVAAVAIVASLIFVGLQLRQSDKTQRALMHQARADRSVGVAQLMSDPDVAQLLSKVARGEKLFSAAEIFQLMGILRTQVFAVDDTIWQKSKGLLDEAAAESAWQSTRQLLSFPAMRATWALARAGFSPSLVANIEEHAIADAPMFAGDLAAAWQGAYSELMVQYNNQTNLGGTRDR